MAILTWDAEGKRLYETGVSKVVLFTAAASGGYDKGVAWNGITAVNESPSGAEATKLYANNHKYLELLSAEEFGGTIEAYTYPDEFEACDGSKTVVAGVTVGQQSRVGFALCYRTEVGNDTQGDDHGYKIHFVWGCKAQPSEVGHSTINESPEAVTFSWTFTTTPVEVEAEGYKATSHMVIDTARLGASDKTKLDTLMTKVYGSTNAEPAMPTPDEVITAFK